MRIAQPLARPIALLLRETERRRQHLQLQKEIVRRQTSGPKTRHHRGTHGRIPDPGQPFEQRPIAGQIALRLELLEHRRHERVDDGIAIVVHAEEGADDGIRVRLGQAFEQRNGRRGGKGR